MFTTDRLDEIKKRGEEAKKDFKNRCLLVIETLVDMDIKYNDIEKLKEDIYKIAHIGLQTCGNKHEDWVEEMEKLFHHFENDGLI